MDGDDRGVIVARRLAARLDLGAAAEQHIAALVGESDLLLAAIRRRDATSEGSVLPLAAHLDQPERTRAIYLLSLARWPMPPIERARLDALYDTVQLALARPDLTGLEARNLIEGLRAAAQREAGSDPAVVARIASAPRSFVSRSPARLAATATAIEAARRRGLPSIEVTPAGTAAWRVECISHDAPGLLARLTGALFMMEFEVEDAIVATWPDQIAYDALVVHAIGAQAVSRASAPDPESLTVAFRRELAPRGRDARLDGIAVHFDQKASPWYTVCRLHVAPAPGLLSLLSAEMANADVNIVSANLRTDGSHIVVEFELTDRAGGKLDHAHEQTVQQLLLGTDAPIRARSLLARLGLRRT